LSADQVDSDEGVTLNVRMKKLLRDRIDEAAVDWAMNRSEWVIHTIEDALRRGPRGRTVQVQVQRERITIAGHVAPRLCNHPMPLRSEPDSRGNSRCLACNSIIRQLP
jgi:hypothetical protein